MNPCPDSRALPPPVEFTVQNFKDGFPITYRLVGGQYFHRLGYAGDFMPTGCDAYPGAAAHARRLHKVDSPFARIAA
jgi:hypothetical protein